MKWLKPFLRKESNKVAKEPDNRNNPQEEIMKRITKQMGETISDDFFKKYPLNLFSYGDKYYIADGKGIHLDLDFRKEDIIKALKENNDDIKKAFHALLGEKPVIKKYVSKTKSPEEQLIERITREYNHFKDKQEPLTLEKVDEFFGGGYHLTDENGDEYGFIFKKDEIIKALKENGYNIKNAFRDLIKLGQEGHKESQIQAEINRLKGVEYRKVVREEAEKRLYGKVKENKRTVISEKDKEIIFKKFNKECVICSRKEELHIHHKDHNPSNNRMDNLIVLCGVCHKKIHMKVR